MKKLGLMNILRKAHQGTIGRTIPNGILLNFNMGASNRDWAIDVALINIVHDECSPIRDMYNGENISSNILTFLT